MIHRVSELGNDVVSFAFFTILLGYLVVKGLAASGGRVEAEMREEAATSNR